MLPYWLLFGVCAIGAMITYRSVRPQSEALIYLTIAGILITLMIGFRYHVGGDWWGYVRIFRRIELTGFFASMGNSDPGYVLVNSLAAKLGGGLALADLICAAIFTAGLVRFASHQPNPWLVLVIAVPYLIIVVAMGYSRQAVAIGLLMFGLAARGETSLSRLAFYVFAAATFHKTAIVVLPLIALSRTANRLVMAILGGLIAIILYYTFLSSSIDGLMHSYVTEKYSSQGATIRIIMNLIAAVLFFISRSRLYLTSADDKLWRNFSLSSIVLTILLIATPSSTAVDRLALYIIPLQLLVLSRLPFAWGRFKPDLRHTNMTVVGSFPITFAVIAYSGLAQYIWLTRATNAPAWIPYQTFGFS